jgi:hypothetical protein
VNGQASGSVPPNDMLQGPVTGVPRTRVLRAPVLSRSPRAMIAVVAVAERER